MDVLFAVMETILISLYVSISTLGGPDTLSISSRALKEIFFWAEGLNSKLKILSKPCCKQMCCHSGFIVPFIEHSTVDSIILKAFRIFKVVNKNWLQLKANSCMSP